MNKTIEKRLIKDLNSFFAGFGVKTVDFGSHKLKIKKPKKNATIKET